MPRLAEIGPLHSEFRAKVEELTSELAAAKIPLRPYETVRTPWRQAELFAIGRQTGTKGKTVTRARAWESMHQYGLAVDFVFNVGGKWTWQEPTPGMWRELAPRAERHGLRTLSFEKPHVEFKYPLSQLMSGNFPAEGGERWQTWLEECVERWGAHSRDISGIRHPAAPPLIHLLTESRPTLDEIG